MVNETDVQTSGVANCDSIRGLSRSFLDGWVLDGHLSAFDGLRVHNVRQFWFFDYLVDELFRLASEKIQVCLAAGYVTYLDQ